MEDPLIGESIRVCKHKTALLFDFLQVSIKVAVILICFFVFLPKAVNADVVSGIAPVQSFSPAVKVRTDVLGAIMANVNVDAPLITSIIAIPDISKIKSAVNDVAGFIDKSINPHGADGSAAVTQSISEDRNANLISEIIPVKSVPGIIGQAIIGSTDMLGDTLTSFGEILTSSVTTVTDSAGNLISLARLPAFANHGNNNSPIALKHSDESGKTATIVFDSGHEGKLTLPDISQVENLVNGATSHLGKLFGLNNDSEIATALTARVSPILSRTQISNQAAAGTTGVVSNALAEADNVISTSANGVADFIRYIFDYFSTKEAGLQESIITSLTNQNTLTHAAASATSTVKSSVVQLQTTIVNRIDPSVLSRLANLENAVFNSGNLRNFQQQQSILDTQQNDSLAQNLGQGISSSVSSILNSGTSPISATTGAFSSSVIIDGLLTTSNVIINGNLTVNGTTTSSTGGGISVLNFFANNASSTNFSSTNANLVNLIFGFATGTAATTTNSFSNTAASVNLFSTNGNIGLLTVGNATTTAISATTASTTNFFLSGTGYAATNCLQVDATGQVTGTGLACAVASTPNSKWATSTGSFLTITPNGGNNVGIGIGTSTPAWALQVASSTAPQLTLSDPSNSANNNWSFRNAGGNLYVATTSPINYATSTNTAFTIDQNGNVGIGTSTLASKLTISSPSNNTLLSLLTSSITATNTTLLLQNPDTTAGNMNIIGFADNSGVIQGAIGAQYTSFVGGGTGADIVFGSKTSQGEGLGGVLAERAVLTAGGNFGIATTSPSGKFAIGYGGQAMEVHSLLGPSAVITLGYNASSETTRLYGGTGRLAFNINNGNGAQALGVETNFGGAALGVFSNNPQDTGTDRLGLLFVGNIFASSSVDFPAAIFRGVPNQTADYLQVRSSPATNGDILTVNSAGNVGIGTTTPAWKLQMVSAIGPQLSLSDPSTQTNNHWIFRNAGGFLYVTPASSLDFATSSSVGGTALTIDPSGNVGIGTSTPSQKLALGYGNSGVIEIHSQLNDPNWGPAAAITLGYLNSGETTRLYGGAGRLAFAVNGGNGAHALEFNLITGHMGIVANNPTDTGTDTFAPLDVSEINASSTQNVIAGIFRGHPNQTVDYFQVRSSPATNGDIFAINSAGNVGIGSSSPTSLLTVAGNAAFTGTASTTNLILSGAGYAATNCLQVSVTGAVTGTGSACGSGGGGTGNSNWATSTSAFLSITPNGGNNVGVGIGTSTPAWALEVASSTKPQLALSDGSVTSNAWTFRSAGNFLYIATTSPVNYATSSFTAMTFDNGGKIGIASTTPFARLSVNPLAGDINQFVVGSSSATSFIITPGGSVGIGTTSPWATFAIQTTGTTKSASTTPLLVIATSSPALGNTTALFINSSGSLAIGTTNIASNSTFFQVNNPLVGTDAFNIVDEGGGSASVRSTSLFVTSSNAGTNTYYSAFEHSAGITFSAPVNSAAASAQSTGAPYHAIVNGSCGTSLNCYGLLAGGTGGGTLASPTAVLTGNSLPGFGIAGQTNTTAGSGMTIGASILGSVDGAVSTNILPTSLTFNTSTSSASGMTEKMRITSGGFVGIGTSTPKWLLDLASSTRPQLALSDPSTLTNNHWTFRNAGGSLFIATSSGATFATSSSMLTLNNTSATSTVNFFGATTTGLTAGIGVALPSSLSNMIIVGDGKVSASIAVVNGSICVDSDGWCTASTTTATGGTVAAVQFTTGSTDIAEMYASSEQLQVGDIVAANQGINVTEATQANATKILGIVSTKPGLLLGQSSDEDTGSQGQFPIALSGRVPLKVNVEGGAIAVGDPITISSTPGIGMKATSTDEAIVAMALEPFNSGTSGTILAFVSRQPFTSANFPSNPAITGNISDGLMSQIVTAVKNMIESVDGWVVSKISGTLAIFNRVEVGTAAISEGIEMTDTATGQLYCVTIKNGDWNKILGSCVPSSMQLSNVSSGNNTGTTSEAVVPPNTQATSTTEVGNTGTTTEAVSPPSPDTTASTTPNTLSQATGDTSGSIANNPQPTVSVPPTPPNPGTNVTQPDPQGAGVSPSSDTTSNVTPP